MRNTSEDGGHEDGRRRVPSVDDSSIGSLSSTGGDGTRCGGEIVPKDGDSESLGSFSVVA